MMDIDGNTPLWQLSVNDVKRLLDESISSIKPVPVKQMPELMYGLDGICELFNVTKPVAIQIKNSDEFRPAIYQRGRTIVINTVIARKIMFKTNDKR